MTDTLAIGLKSVSEVKMIPTIEELERLLTLRAEVIEQTLRVPMGQIAEEGKAAFAWVAEHGGEQFVRELVDLMRERKRLLYEVGELRGFKERVEKTVQTYVEYGDRLDHVNNLEIMLSALQRAIAEDRDQPQIRDYSR
jgi:hypothetical protein